MKNAYVTFIDVEPKKRFRRKPASSETDAYTQHLILKHAFCNLPDLSLHKLPKLPCLEAHFGAAGVKIL